jgi:tripartite-type tricarboxylate transporter receptor subunit TctC
MHAHATIRRREAILATVALASGVDAGAQKGTGRIGWPTQPVKLLVGFPPGSTPDTAARILADAMGKAWGQTIVVENKPGASGNIAADLVAKASDTHTLGVVINGNLTSAKLLNPKLAYDPAKDFTLLSLLTTAPLLLVAPASQPDGAAFIAAARAGGREWNYGSVGVGSVGHLGMELLKARAGGLQAVHIPFNGNPAVVTALIAGQIQMALMPPGIALPQVKAGKLRAIGVTGARSTLAPDVAPLAALGIASDEIEVWTALVGPASLPGPARERLAYEIPAFVRGDEARQALFAAGWRAQGSSADVLARRVAAETDVMRGIITAQGIRLE